MTGLMWLALALTVLVVSLAGFAGWLIWEQWTGQDDPIVDLGDAPADACGCLHCTDDPDRLDRLTGAPW